MVTVEDKIEQWKKLLLDLGKRNPLVNYRNTKRGTLNIIQPDLYTLWDEIVQQEKTLTFANTSEDWDVGETEIAVREQIETVTVMKGDLNSDRSVLDQQAVLCNLKSKARVFMEEQGINALFLCVGFLHWNEKEGSSDFFDAPLVLVPVSIEQENIWAPYTISLQGDEIIVNPTMSYKLENDFGIRLSSFNSETDDLQQFFHSVRSSIRYMHDWTLEEKAGIALLSFQKISMYRDLERRKKDIAANPIVRALNGESGVLPKFDLDAIHNYDFDQQSPQDVFQIVDADSSQQTAILCAQKGISFVLQGPPGTGKSQTITNIIADRLAHGKKVLFVSEKKAALDVVYSRLKKAGLSDFCLVMHSDKANKKQIMSQFSDVLELANKRAGIKNEVYQQLEQLQRDRDELNEYAKELHEVIQPMEVSIYQVNGILAHLESYPDVICGFESVKNTTAKEQRERIALLRQLSLKLKGMAKGYQNNPWRGCNLQYINNELRQNLSVECAQIDNGLSEFARITGEIGTEFHVSGLDTCYGLQRLRHIFQVGADAPKISIPEHWFDSAAWAAVGQAIEDGKNLHDRYEKLAADIAAQKQLVSDRIPEIKDESIDSNLLANYQKELSEINHYVDINPHFSIWKSNEFAEENIRRLKEFIEEYDELKGNVSRTFDDGIYEIDSESILLRYRTDYQSILKHLNAQYRSDRKQFAAHTLEIGRNLSDEEIIRLLIVLHQMADIRNHVCMEEGSFRAALAELYHGLDTDLSVVERERKTFDNIRSYIVLLEKMCTLLGDAQEKESYYASSIGTCYQGLLCDWDEISEAFAWVQKYCAALRRENLYVGGFVAAASDGEFFSSLCQKWSEEIEDNLNMYQRAMDDFIHLFDEKTAFLEADFDVLRGRIKDCNNLSALEDWIDFKHLKDDGDSLGLSDYLKTALTDNIQPDDLVGAYEKRFYKLWLDQIVPDHPAVARFRASSQNARISDFGKLDTAQFEIAQKRIRGHLINSLPLIGTITSGDDEISILKREANKQRKIMPVRKLFNTIPESVQALKPCMMMSPLSVSLFLESPQFVYDTVIFDEASQIKTENAVGAIIRGKQVIIAGDSHQLPPTNFFVSGASDDDDDDDDYEMGAFESVLDEAALLPSETLLWHYRSKNEQLIAFSNAKIYNRKLITFPSSIETGKDIGVEFISVPNGFYDRGGRKGNVAEAKKVAELIYQHFKDHPDRSLGVITFGVVQQMAVEEQVRQMRMQSANHSYESFFREDGLEPFFIKSLENVQGDERDTIIFSVGYGKDAYGKMYNSFGPLSKDGGGRRLNVAITRAKYNVKLVSSILATDINVSSGKEGPKLLQAYIDYASRGPKVLDAAPVEQEELEYDSPFEEAVYNFLDSKGYRVGTQIGCSGYRIDLGVKHPTLNGRYVLGIECDGATYHSAKTARERDRLRQDILELMGWKIYRIWSTDWIKDPATEGRKLVEAVEAAIASYSEETFMQPKNAKEEKQLSEDMFKVVEWTEDDKRKVLFKFQNFPSRDDFYNDVRQKVRPYTSKGILDYIIQTLYPISFDDICRWYLPFTGKERVSPAIKKEIKLLLIQNRADYVTDEEGFYYPLSDQKIIVRTAGDRKISQISLEELGTGLSKVARAQEKAGITKESLIRETVKTFGYQKLSAQVMNRMESAFERLVERQVIAVDSNGHVTWIPAAH